LSALLLLFAIAPLAVFQITTNAYASTPFYTQPGVQNQFPGNATAGHRIVIFTTVTGAACAVVCITRYNQVIVNILLPNTSNVLSTAPDNPAVNMVTAPATRGPWHLTVQVLWNDYPTGGTTAIFETTITIQVI